MLFALGFIENALNDLFGALSQTIVKIFLAILIFLFGFILGKLVGRVVYKFLEEIEINNFLKKSLGLKINVDNLISNFLSYIIYFLALIAALEQIGVANIILYLISIIVILIILVSFFLAIRDFIPNFISGLYLYSKEHLKQGYNIEINDIKGELLHIDLLHLKIKTKTGDIIYMPNSVAANSKIKVRKN